MVSRSIYIFVGKPDVKCTGWEGSRPTEVVRSAATLSPLPLSPPLFSLVKPIRWVISRFFLLVCSDYCRLWTMVFCGVWGGGGGSRKGFLRKKETSDPMDEEASRDTRSIDSESGGCFSLVGCEERILLLYTYYYGITDLMKHHQVIGGLFDVFFCRVCRGSRVSVGVGRGGGLYGCCCCYIQQQLAAA